MLISDKIFIYWCITIIIWIITSIMDHVSNRNRVKAEREKANSIFLLYKEIKRVNDRVAFVSHVKAETVESGEKEAKGGKEGSKGYKK